LAGTAAPLFARDDRWDDERPDRVSEASPADILADLARAAPAEDEGASIAPSVARALSAGFGDPTAPSRIADLISLAEVNLPVARLIEGHVNARHLLRRLGGPLNSGLHAVWGADGDEPCTIKDGVLKGRKRFASGLGVVKHAVISVSVAEGTRLAVVPADDWARQHPETWTMTGMRATVSGDFDLTGLEPVWLGGPDAWFEEPTFLGGVWRIAALQLGGAFGLLGAARDHLESLGRLDSDAQVARLAPLAGRSLAARGLVERAADVAEGAEGRRDPERAVALSISARLLTEDIAQDTVKAVERSVGLAHFEANSETGRRARDLATYCRQVARDAFEQKAGRILLGRGGRMSEVWDG
jgi:hypothetical protein